MKHKITSGRHRNLLFWGLGCVGAGLLFYILAQQGIGIPCLFYKVTGFQCPGCGNTRAALALLRLDVKAAFSYNLLFPVEFFYLGWVLLHCSKSYLQGKHFSYQPPWVWLDVGMLVLVLLWWVIRNIM